MKPVSNNDLINFDWLVLFICPDVWDETKPFRFRGFIMIVLYTLSCIFWFSCIRIVLFFIGVPNKNFYIEYSVVIGVGILMGLAGHFEFKKYIKKNEGENLNKNL